MLRCASLRCCPALRRTRLENLAGPCHLCCRSWSRSTRSWRPSPRASRAACRPPPAPRERLGSARLGSARCIRISGRRQGVMAGRLRPWEALGTPVKWGAIRGEERGAALRSGSCGGVAAPGAGAENSGPLFHPCASLVCVAGLAQYVGAAELLRILSPSLILPDYPLSVPGTCPTHLSHLPMRTEHFHILHCAFCPIPNCNTYARKAHAEKERHGAPAGQKPASRCCSCIARPGRKGQSRPQPSTLEAGISAKLGQPPLRMI